MSYSLTEPHPTLPSHKPARTGRGGAGNYNTSPSTLWPTAPSTTSPPSTTRRASSTSTNSSTGSHAASTSTGRGGAGNIGPASSASFSFSHELALQQSRDSRAARRALVGRGGMGNVVEEKAAAKEVRHGSVSSVESAPENGWGWKRLRRGS